MSSNPKMTSIPSALAAGSPLDQIVNGRHIAPSRHALLERAVTLTRKTTIQGRPQQDALEAIGSSSPGSSSNSVQQTYNEIGNRQHYDYQDDDNYGYALSGPEEDDFQQSPPPSSSRQRVLDLRASRLDLQHHPPSTSYIKPNTHSRSPNPSSHLISNAFRDSVASDMSFNSISGANERLSMVGDDPSSFRKDSDRIAEAVQNLALRRRQSIDTVRSSEFGEGGKWDKAWGDSDEEDDEDEDGTGQNLGDVDVEGKMGHQWGALDGFGQGQWQTQDDSRRRTLTSGLGESGSSRLPDLQDASGVKHVVSLTPSLQSTKQKLQVGRDNREEYGRMERRDTMRSMAGDIGQVSATASMPQYGNDFQGSNGASPSHRQSFASDMSHSNAHVYVWPPTPAASEHGGSSEGKHGIVSSNDTLQAYSPGMGIAQRATIEYMEAQELARKNAKLVEVPLPPVTPSAALARPLDAPILRGDGRPTTARVWSGTGSGHPTGRRPPQPPSRTAEEERYSDPNRPLPSQSSISDLGKVRRRAIEDHDGRESMVSDLDVETLRLDGNSQSGFGNDWDSRRGSATSIGSFSSEKIREQRDRRSQANIHSSYSQASDAPSTLDKRSSNGTIRQMLSSSTSRENLHRSWNGGQMANRGDDFVRGPPKRSNTGPDSYQTSTDARQTVNGSSLTFATPKPERGERKPSVAVKGAMNDSPAEKFLSLAITHHETGDLSRSAYYFERSAKVDGGCIVGMCMWGMALREGWGVRKDQQKGFEWISRAASRAGELMAGTQSVIKSEAELKAIRSEMKLSVYELGKCFCYGWGIKMDKPMALEYFELAAKLGDADAQAEAGALLAAGKGCKKDLKKAATYYRMAEAQGYDTVGLSWIHKDKYDPVRPVK